MNNAKHSPSTFTFAALCLLPSLISGDPQHASSQEAYTRSIHPENAQALHQNPEDPVTQMTLRGGFVLLCLTSGVVLFKDNRVPQKPCKPKQDAPTNIPKKKHQRSRSCPQPLQHPLSMQQIKKNKSFPLLENSSMDVTEEWNLVIQDANKNKLKKKISPYPYTQQETPQKS